MVVQLIEVHIHDSISGYLMGQAYPPVARVEMLGERCRKTLYPELPRADVGLIGCTVFGDPSHKSAHIVPLK